MRAPSLPVLLLHAVAACGPPAEAPPATSNESDAPARDTDVTPPDDPSDTSAEVDVIGPFPARFTERSGPLRADPTWTPPRGTPGVSEPHHAIVLWAELDGADPPEILASVDPVGRWEGGIHAVFRLGTAGPVEDAPLTARLAGLSGTVHAALDLDGDGRDDLLHGPRALSWSEADGTWTTISLPQAQGFHRPHMAAFDLDRDGLLDLVPTPEACNGTPLGALHQQGARHFVLRPDTFTPEASAARGVLYTLMPYYDASGAVSVLATGSSCGTATHPGAFREVGRTPDGLPVLDLADLFPDDAWYLTDPSYQPNPHPLKANPMGAAIADLDGDGVEDAIVAIVGGSRDVFMGRPSGPFASPPALGPRHNPDRDPVTMDFPWSVVPIDLDGDGRLELLKTMGDDYTSFMAVLHNYQMAQTLWTRRTASAPFEEVAGGTGWEVAGSHRGLLLADGDGDGAPDALLGGFGDAPRLLSLDESAPLLGVRLVGTTGDPHGIGVSLRAEAPSHLPQRIQHGVTGNAGGLARPVTWFSAPDLDTPVVVHIPWAAGWTQTVALSAGAVHTVEEPPTLTVHHPTRRLVADGRTQIRLTLVGRDSLGRVDPDAVLTLAVEGEGSLEGTVRAVPGGGLEAILRAPASAGVARVVATIDGRPLGITPKIWFTDPT